VRNSVGAIPASRRIVVISGSRYAPSSIVRNATRSCVATRYSGFAVVGAVAVGSRSTGRPPSGVDADAEGECGVAGVRDDWCEGEGEGEEDVDDGACDGVGEADGDADSEGDADVEGDSDGVSGDGEGAGTVGAIAAVSGRDVSSSPVCVSAITAGTATAAATTTAPTRNRRLCRSRDPRWSPEGPGAPGPVSSSAKVMSAKLVGDAIRLPPSMLRAPGGHR